jgi:histidine phosphotransferase ChpT
MGQHTVNLAALIGSRICHDLISPIGAITNGLELLDMSGAASGPEMELIADSVGNAGARIRFFRIAFGAASDQPLSRSEVCTVLEDVNRGSRMVTRWGPLEPQPRGDVRLAFLAILCCETALPFGGEIQVVCENGRWTIEGRGDRLITDPDLWKVLEVPGSAPVTPAQVQFALLPELLRDEGRSLRSELTDDMVSLHF